ncbi:pilus assembly protein CpaF [Desulfotomaculum arcticum]|uniref:Pilus assembly protein CpaF n=1 Tax=Desulfotruncus arcticus DSM 17038 TaxID=1121424 RepID=A0A1I2Z9K3_9FIRM|nr:ATPase, T2SS/T4P/T4SS family [Desulfotruncus arcticus]SFH34255.1 pilus assembly protein CpaF [Desulfotomaculum arcticum] [Desulfotruncus arcticus DSM 17038]
MGIDVALIESLAKNCLGFVVNDELLKSADEELIIAAENIPGMTHQQFLNIRGHVQEQLSKRLRPEDRSKSRDPQVRSQLKSIVMRALLDLSIPLGDYAAQTLVEELGNDLLGFGPIEPYFYDPEVTEIKASRDIVYIEKNGIENAAEGVHFRDEQHIRDVLERMIAPTGRKVDLNNPEVNARLFDGSRLIAQIPPIAVKGTMITIRRFRMDMTVENLLKRKAVSEEVLDFLKAAIISRLNIVISGGTSSGKTTVLNCLASFIPANESIITIEEPAELQLQHPNVRPMEANSQTEYTQRRLVQSSLRMAPKRIIIGECRAGETFDMLQAMNTGHEGSITTGHANSAWHCRSRFVNMVQMAGMELPYEAIIEQIADAVDLFVHVKKDKNGRRRLDHICEVVGVKKNNEGILNVNLNPVWRYNPQKDAFEFVAEKFHRCERLVEQGGWKT